MRLLTGIITLLVIQSVLIIILLFQRKKRQRAEKALRGAEGRVSGLISVERDIAERKGAELERETTIEFLRMVNESTGTQDLVRAAATFFQQQSGCEAVGVRLHEGEDYPYFEARGFPREFVLAENSLCAKDKAGRVLRNSAGNPVMECMCGNVICGRFDPSKPFFTTHGSFWTNSTTQLLASTTAADRQTRTRNHCNGEGYESVALVPLRLGEQRLGLLQLNDRRKGVFSQEVIALWERLAGHLSVALAKFRTEEALRESEGRYHSLFENMLEGFAYCRMLFDGDRPQDFIYLAVNSAFEKLTGLKNVAGRRVTEVIPRIRESDPQLFEIYGRVAMTGKPERFEIFIEALSAWFFISVYSPKKEHFVAVFDVVTERKRSEDALRKSEQKYRSLVDNALVGIYRSTPEGKFLYVNDALVKIFECETAENLLSSPVQMRYKKSEDRESFLELLGKKGKIPYYEVEVPTTTGKLKTVALSAVLGEGFISGMVIDITGQKKLEEQLRQAQKMESIGQLAGGIAHDFNNILSAIIGYGHVALMKMATDDPLRHTIESMLEAADRAAYLTHGLLAFSRKQGGNKKLTDVNAIVGKAEKFLLRVIREDIEFKTFLHGGALPVLADANQIEQVLMNLATNARDAMPLGGAFTIRTERISLDENFIRVHGYGRPGAYALMTLSDTGTGMDEKTRERIFDPFFTTKDVGQGTGLGLSVVYGIIKQHDGYINAYSEPGRGTTFRIYLPMTAEEGREDAAPGEAESPRKGTETILLAEDENSLRKLNTTVLEQFGYTVISAVDGEDAVKKFVENRDRIHLLFFDLIMPKMTGKEAYEAIKKIKPAIRILFTSGYPSDVLHERTSLDNDLSVVYKPISPFDLLKKVRSLLDGDAPQDPAAA